MLELLPSLIAAPFLPTFDAVTFPRTHIESLRPRGRIAAKELRFQLYRQPRIELVAFGTPERVTDKERDERCTTEESTINRKEKDSNRNERGKKEGSYWRWNKSEV